MSISPLKSLTINITLKKDKPVIEMISKENSVNLYNLIKKIEREMFKSIIEPLFLCGGEGKSMEVVYSPTWEEFLDMFPTKRDYISRLEEELREINNRYRMGFTEEEAKILQKREKSLRYCYDIIVNEWQLISRPCLKFNSEEEGIRYMIKEKMIDLKETDIVIHKEKVPEEGNIEIMERS